MYALGWPTQDVARQLTTFTRLMAGETRMDCITGASGFKGLVGHVGTYDHLKLKHNPEPANCHMPTATATPE
jgi:hypothetical protein